MREFREIPSPEENEDERYEKFLDEMDKFFNELENYAVEKTIQKSLSGQHEFFIGNSTRKHLFECFKNMAEYIVKNDIKDVVFVDRLSRSAYIGLKEYLRLAHSDVEHPNIYFVNPRGFNLDNFEDTTMSLRMRLFATDNDKYKRIDETFVERYKYLMQDKDKPVMVFDNCIHTGRTILPVLASLDRLGFRNMHVGVYSNERSGLVTPNFTMTNNPIVSACAPFEVDYLLEKNMDITSSPKEDEQGNYKMFAARLRQELIDLVDEEFEKYKKSK